MSKSISKKQIINKKESIDILNFQKESTFFFKLTNFNKILKNFSSIKVLNFDEQDIDIIKKEIKLYHSLIKDNKNNILIDVLKYYANRIKDMKEVDQSNSEKAIKIKEIIDNYNGKKRLTLKMICIEYYKQHSKTISKMTVSRILRNKLKMRYKKTVLKSQKLSEENYILMNFFF